MNLSKEFANELKVALKGLNYLKTAKKVIQQEVSEYIDAVTVENILSSGSGDLTSLSDTQTYHFLNAIYKFTKDERFDPTQLLDFENNLDDGIEDNDDWEMVDGELKRKQKDRIPRYYFNFDFKSKFADAYDNKKTSRVVMALFRNTKKYEDIYNKDLYDFDYEELRSVLKSFKTKTIRSLQNQISTIERYIEFAKKHSKTKFDQVNFAKELNARGKIEDLLDSNAVENMIFSKDEIMAMAMGADNAQDGVILGLLFDGVSHKNEFYELANLTKQDVHNIDGTDRSMTLKSLDKSTGEISEREIPMSYETAILVKGALDQDVKYTSTTSKDNVSTTRNYKIAEGNHVLRGLRGKATVKGQIVSQRILRIADINDEKYLNATTVSYSGQLHYADELLEAGHGLEDVIEKVLNRFAIPNNLSSQFYLRTRIEKFLEV